jgi:hypothetical protein
MGRQGRAVWGTPLGGSVGIHQMRDTLQEQLEWGRLLEGTPGTAPQAAAV